MLDSSWHLSLTAAYLPAWIIVALTWHFRIFTGTNVGLVLAVHLLFGCVLYAHRHVRTLTARSIHTQTIVGKLVLLHRNPV